LKVDATRASLMMCAALALAAPLFVAFGALSDRIGRKPIILSGFLLSALCTLPLFDALAAAANPALAEAQQRVVTTLTAEPDDCAWKPERLGVAMGMRSANGCELGKRWLSDRAVRYSLQPGSGNAVISVAGERIEIGTDDTAMRDRLDALLDAAGYPRSADPQRIDTPRVVGILFVLMVFVTMVYGPIAALLVEMFPTRVRCSSVSLPYHIGNGWFGGLLPSAAFAISAATGDMTSGLWYSVVIALTSCAIGFVFVRESRNVDLEQVGR
jgi:nitrate/nitrite transporter NarK